MLWYTWFLVHFVLVWRWPRWGVWIFAVTSAFYVIVNQWMPGVPSLAGMMADAPSNVERPLKGVEEHVYIVLVFALSSALGYGVRRHRVARHESIYRRSVPSLTACHTDSIGETSVPIASFADSLSVEPLSPRVTDRLSPSMLLSAARSLWDRTAPLLPTVVFCVGLEWVSSRPSWIELLSTATTTLSSWPWIGAYVFGEMVALSLSFYISLLIDRRGSLEVGRGSRDRWCVSPDATSCATLSGFVYVYVWLMALVYFCILHVLPILLLRLSWFPVSHESIGGSVRFWTMGIFVLTAFIWLTILCLDSMWYGSFRSTNSAAAPYETLPLKNAAMSQRPMFDRSFPDFSNGELHAHPHQVAYSDSLSNDARASFYLPPDGHSARRHPSRYYSTRFPSADRSASRSDPQPHRQHDQPPHWHQQRHVSQQQPPGQHPHERHFSEQQSHDSHEQQRYDSYKQQSHDPHEQQYRDPHEQHFQQPRVARPSSYHDPGRDAVSPMTAESQDSPISNPEISSSLPVHLAHSDPLVSSTGRWATRNRQNFLTVGEMHGFIQSGAMKPASYVNTTRNRRFSISGNQSAPRAMSNDPSSDPPSGGPPTSHKAQLSLHNLYT